MTGTGREALARFVGDLNRLRRLAGSPSLNRLVTLSAGGGRPLARSTISDKLNAKSVPEWDFVLSYVAACVAHADAAGYPLPAELADPAWWDAEHWRMLGVLDTTRDDDRLGAALRAESHRRSGTHDAYRLVPKQLPAAVRHFVGRSAELAALDAALPPASSATGGAVVISAISGAAGIGKTALALHWAHRVRDRFLDGQLYVNLRGFDPSGSAMRPADAVRGFLDAFGVPPQRLPADQQSQAGLYRSLLAGRRVLIVLDNARDAEQVRPLLPGAPGCLVVVTSRSQLTSLVAAEDARPTTIDVLSTVDATQLLVNRIGGDRVAADPAATGRIVELCAGLPLAMVIVAARAAIHPEFTMAALADELSAARGGLDAFAGGDAASDVRAVFSWSYRALSPAAAELFRLLGLHPGPDIDAAAVASLAGSPAPVSRRLLGELTGAHLLIEHTPGRYRLHDLLRVYAGEQAGVEDGEDRRCAATHRLLDHYLHSAYAATRCLDPHLEPVTLSPPRPGVTPLRFAGHDEAMTWLAAERAVLLAAVTLAAGAGFDSHAWQLPLTMATFLYRHGHWRDYAETQRIAAAAADRLGDRRAQAIAHRQLGRAYTLLGQFDHAHTHHRRALAWWCELGDDAGQARTHLALAWACERQGDYVQGADHAQRSLVHIRATGDQAWEARALNALGWCQAQFGEYDLARTHCLRALDLFQRLGDRDGQAGTLDSLGYIQHRIGRHDDAIGFYRQALRLYRDLGDRYYEADTLHHLGDTNHAAGDGRDAAAAWSLALRILDELDHPQAEQVRTKLDGLNR